MRVIGIGDNVCDKYEHQKIMYPGGQALNFAVYAKKLGAESAYMGVFGTDEAAGHVMAALDKYQVDRSRCRQCEGENGCARVALEDGDRIFLGSNKGGVLKEHPLVLDDADLDYIRSFAVCHTSNNSYLDSQLPKLKEAGVPVSYDFSDKWDEPGLLERVAPFIDYAFLSCGPVGREKAEALCRWLCGKGPQMAIATCGSAGAILYDGKDFYTQRPHLVEAVDTLGAGDSFTAAFLIHWLGSGSIQQSLERAAVFASETCLVYGAFGEGKPYI